MTDHSQDSSINDNPRNQHHSLLLKGLQEFNSREFYEAHETLEDYWRMLKDDEKELVQSIIQAAVAYYHFGRGNRVGARKLLVRAVARAESVARDTLGIKTEPYLETIKKSLQTVESDSNEAMEMPTISFI
jgi:predicted metal-dependent hydrolase